MQAAFIMSFVANLALSLVSLAILPDTVAIHFGRGGVADGWASNTVSTLTMLSIHVFVFASLYFSPQLIARVPRNWVSLPNRSYWLAPQRRGQAVELFSRYLWQFGTALFLFMFFAGLLSLRANLSDPVRLDETALLSALGVFLVYTVYWTIALVRAFRIPSTG